jgi:hypothetical protein
MAFLSVMPTQFLGHSRASTGSACGARMIALLPVLR